MDLARVRRWPFFDPEFVATTLVVGVAYYADAVASGTGDMAAFIQRRPQALARQLHQTEAREEGPGLRAQPQGARLGRSQGRRAANTVECFFSISKRGMTGVYQHCAKKHLHR